jgi:hypothetical protein|tara:strand:- start:7420 stop:7602 length:183 start_codon:yes stop_codon:yes gene_type:complete
MGVKVGVHGKKWDGAWRGNNPEYKKGHDRIFKGSKKIKLEKKKAVKEKQEPQLIDSSKMI